MKKLIFPILALCALGPAAPAAIRINEVHLNPEGPDLNYEFIELKSTTNGVESLAGLSLVIINNALTDDGVAQNPGEILEVLDLNDLSTGTNGLLLLGDGYTDAPPGGPWSGAIDPATALGDPAGLGPSDIKTNTGLTLILVRNYNATAGPKGFDLDKDVIAGANAISTGNGTLDWKQVPLPPGSVPLWADADVIDSIGTRDYADTGETALGNRAPYVPAAADLNVTWAGSSLGVGSNQAGVARDPDSFARQLGNDTPSSAASYYGGKMNNTNPTPTDILYRSTRIFGPGNMLGQVTPGRPNLAASLPATDFRINEVGLNPSGTASSDNRYQYVEIINNDGQSRSLSGYWLILLDSNDDSANALDPSPGVGAILEEWNLSDFATGANGLLLLGDGFSPTYNPFQDATSPQTSVGDPSAKKGPPASSGWGQGDLRFKDGCTLLLVKGYSPPTIRDLDATPQDGVLDSAPWTSISDQIGFTQANKTTIGRTYSGVDLRPVMNALSAPDNMSRKLGNIANNSNLAWYGGNFPGSSSPMTVGFEDSKPINVSDTFAATWFGGFRGAATPGRPNLAAAINPLAPPIPASIRINEAMINPTNTQAQNDDANGEYIELASSNQAIAYLDGLWILVADLKGTVGNIQTGFPLNGYSTGTNGLVLIGDGYDNNNGPYGVPEGPLPANTAAFDPAVGMEGNDLPNNGIAILLVRGVKGPITLNANGRPIGDLDPNDDGELLSPANFTDELVDSIVLNDKFPGAGYAWIDSTAFMPHHIARYPANFAASSAASWYSGQISQPAAASPTINYVGSFSGNFQGAGSPGRANHGATPGPISVNDVVFNEIHFNPAGADKNFEFIELLSVNGASRSLNGYSILAIDNQISNTGSIRHAWSLDGMSTGTNGLFVMGNRYPVPGENPYSRVMRSQTRTGDPPGREGLDSSFSDGCIGAESDNLNLTLVLVRNFTRYIDYDMDDKSPNPPNPQTDPPTLIDSNGLYDSPGDGNFDFFPWTGGGTAGIHDSMLLRSYVPISPPPANPAAPYPYDGWTYGLANLTAAFFPAPAVMFYHPETVARFRNENTPNDPNAWYGGDLRGGLSGNDGNSEAYVTAAQDPTHPPRPDDFLGRVTPGQPNLLRSATADPDRDGLVNLVEQALNTNPTSAASASPVPAPIVINQGGQNYLGLSYPRIITGVDPLPVPYAAEAYAYVVESSTDLQTWTPDPGTGVSALVPVGTATANPDGVTETATVRLPAPITTPPGRQYLRLRIVRR